MCVECGAPASIMYIAAGSRIYERLCGRCIRPEMTEQEAIERLRGAARPAWYISRASVRAQDLRILLESYERMRKALEETETAYLALRRGIRSAIAPVHMSNSMVSDQWIIDHVNEIREALEGKQ